MPTLANISVLKADNATSVVYAAMTPATPDTPAVFQAPPLGLTAATKPEFRIGQTRRPDGSYKVTQSFMYPYHVTDTTTGVTSVVGRVMVTRRVEATNGIPQSVIDEAVAQSANLSDSALPIECDKSGFGPT